MIIKWVNSKGKIINITNAVTSVSWSGSTSQIARSVDITIVHAPNDRNITNLKINIENGDLILLYENDVNIYLGQVFHTTGQVEAGSVTYNSFDFAYHLTQSTATYKFKNYTAERITKKVCKDLQIKVGYIEKTKKIISKIICEDMGIYNIIMKAYTKASKTTHKKYIVRMVGKELNVFTNGDKVSNYVISDKFNITSATYEESAENIINKVIIYNDKGKNVGEVTNKKSIDKFGIFQATYTKEEKVNSKKAAQALLQGIEKTIAIDTLDGNLECIAGNGVKVHDKATGLNALFWIESDTHKWENGIHTMSLELSYKNIWDKQED